MKILQINCVYPNGSTGKIIKDLHNYYKTNGHESRVLYGLGEKLDNDYSFKTMNKLEQSINTLYTYITGYMYKGSMMSTIRIKNHIKKLEPDIVHLHSVNGHTANLYVLLRYLKKKNINTVITNHGEFYFTGSYTHAPADSEQWLTGEKENYKDAKRLTNSWFFDKTYKSIKKFKKIYKDFENLTITSVSPHINERSKKSFLFKDKTNVTVLNGINTSVFYPREYKELIEKHNLKNKRVILHVTSSITNKLKGFDTVVELAKKLSDYVFIIIGAEKDISLPDNCINLGRIYDQDLLAKYYSMANLTILTSSRETFAMMVAESLSCGTPMVGYKAGGPESINIDDYSEFVEYGNFQELVSSIQKWINFKDTKNINIEQVHLKYSKEEMAKNYIRVYKEMLAKI